MEKVNILSMFADLVTLLSELDKSLLLLVNGLHSTLFDKIMETLTNKLFWIPLYIIIIILLFKKYRAFAWWFAAMLIIVVVCVDLGSVHLFKNVFLRPRPCHEPSLFPLLHLVNGKCGGAYGFISSHAANTSAVALSGLFFLGRTYKWITPVLILYAALNCYSRVYLGVHYPSDVLVGAIFGLLTAFVLLRIFNRFLPVMHIKHFRFEHRFRN